MLEPKKRKRVSISSKRQISIPKEFHDALGFDGDAEIQLYNNRLVIKPVNDNNAEDFSSEILKDLIDEGYSGEALLKEFEHRKSQIKSAVSSLISNAKKTAEPFDMNEIFGEDEDET